MNDYIKQGNDFLTSTNTQMKVTYQGLSKPDWGDRPVDYYVIRLWNTKGGITVPFYDSIHNTENKKRKRVTAYDILCHLDDYVEEIFDDFLNEFGYEITSEREYLRLKKLHLDLIDQSRELNKMFTNDEMEQLREIW